MPRTHHPNTQPPFDAFLFDCDGTLTQIEGIDELAAFNSLDRVVSTITATAMTVSGLTLELYEQRLDLIKPTARQISELGKLYIDRLTPGAKEFIDQAHLLGKPVFILSAGIRQAILPLASYLGIPESQVFAVDIEFIEGAYVGFDKTSPLVTQQGKATITEQLRAEYGRLALVGDGMNDVVAQPFVECFVGFGGIQYRENVAKETDIYIKENDLSALHSLWLSAEEQALL